MLYAEAAIPNFWRLEFDPAPLLIVSALENGRYVEIGARALIPHRVRQSLRNVAARTLMPQADSRWTARIAWSFRCSRRG
jgi:hypothetical protein